VGEKVGVTDSAGRLKDVAVGDEVAVAGKVLDGVGSTVSVGVQVGGRTTLLVGVALGNAGMGGKVGGGKRFNAE